MSLYRSLIFREFKVTRKTVILRFILILLCSAVLSFSFILSASVDDISPDEKVDMTSLYTILAMLSAATALLASFDTGIYKADINTGWARYSYVLPATAKQRTNSMFIIKLILFAAALVINMLNPLILGLLMSKGKMEELITVSLNSFLISFAVGFIITTVQQSVTIWAKDKESLKKLGVIAGIAGLAVYMGAESLLPESKDGKLVDSDGSISRLLNSLTGYKMTLIAAGALILLFSASYIITLKALERREP